MEKPVNPITKPLTYEEIMENIGKGTSVKVVVKVDLSDLIDKDIDELNDLMDALILPQNDDRVENCLSDIGYRVVGHVAGTGDSQGSVLIEVNAEVQIYEDEVDFDEG